MYIRKSLKHNSTYVLKKRICAFKDYVKIQYDQSRKQIALKALTLIEYPV